MVKNQMRTLIYQNDVDLRTFLQKIPNLTVTLYVFGMLVAPRIGLVWPIQLKQDERRSMRGNANQMAGDVSIANI